MDRALKRGRRNQDSDADELKADISSRNLFESIMESCIEDDDNHPKVESNAESSVLSVNAGIGDIQQPQQTTFRLLTRSTPKIIRLEPEKTEYRIVRKVKFSYSKEEERELRIRCAQVAVDFDWVLEQSKSQLIVRPSKLVELNTKGELKEKTATRRRKTRRGGKRRLKRFTRALKR
jgi:hypothetical protein